MSTILTVQEVEKSFGTRRVLRGVSFAIHEKDRIGLVGVNGSGKSTLLRLLVGEAEANVADAAPDAGKITRRRDLRLEYVPQEPRLDGARTVLDTLRDGLREQTALLARLEVVGARIAAGGQAGGALDAALHEQARLHEQVAGSGGWEQDHEIRGLAAALALPPMDALVGALSIGERRRVALARALLGRPELLALDEPTNHLDGGTVAWLEGRLAEQPGALLLVTHDRYFLDRVATRIVELDRGQIHSYEGGFRAFLEKQAERMENESARERERASFVRRELDWIRRGPSARGTKQKARIDRFDDVVAARPEAADRVRGPMTLRLPTGGRLGKTIVELRGVGKSLGGKQLFKDLTLIMKPGDRIGIVGPNGAGKTTLVRTILGQLEPDTGQVVVGVNTKFSFLDQGRSDLRDELTVIEEVADGNDHVFLEDGAVHVRTFLRMLLFDDGFADSPVGTLSGGERNRVQLARLLRTGGNLLVLDEPTNDLDLMTLAVLEEALVDFPGCALVVSHDRWFLDRVATGILAFEGDGVVSFHEGDYSSYLAKVAAAGVPVAAAGGGAGAVAPATRVRDRKLTFKERAELDGIEALISTSEQQIIALEATLSDPSIYKERGAEVPRLIADLDAARRQVEQLYARWQELEAIPR